MKKFLLLIAAISSIVFFGCSKYEEERADNILVPSCWVGYEKNIESDVNEIKLYFALYNRCTERSHFYPTIPDRIYWYSVNGNNVEIYYDSQKIPLCYWGEIDGDTINMYSIYWDGAVLFTKQSD